MSRPLDLIWARYDTQSGSKYYLLLYLGEQDEKVNAILSDSVSDQEVLLVRAKVAELRTLSVQELIPWFRNNAPKAYTGIRTFVSKNLTTIKTNDIKTL